jgi:hypothetical protein
MAVSEDEAVRKIHRWLLENGKTNRDTASSLSSLERDSGIMIPRGGNKLINFFTQRPELFGMVYKRGEKYQHVYAIVAVGKDPLSLFSRDAVPRLTQDERDQYADGGKSKSKSRSVRKSKSRSRSAKKSRSRKNRNRRSKSKSRK